MLFSEWDAFHDKALQLQFLAQREQRVLVTTDAVLFEVGAAFAKTGFRAVGAALIATLVADPKNPSPKPDTFSAAWLQR